MAIYWLLDRENRKQRAVSAAAATAAAARSIGRRRCRIRCRRVPRPCRMLDALRKQPPKLFLETSDHGSQRSELFLCRQRGDVADDLVTGLPPFEALGLTRQR